MRYATGTIGTNINEEMVHMIRGIIHEEIQLSEERMQQWTRSEIQTQTSASIQILNEELSLPSIGNPKKKKLKNKSTNTSVAVEEEKIVEEAVIDVGAEPFEIGEFTAGSLPLATYNDFVNFNKKLEYQPFKDNFEQYLSMIQAETCSKTAKSMMGLVMGREVSCLFNMTGVYGHLGFCSTNLYQTLRECLSKRYVFTSEETIRKHIAEKLTEMKDNTKRRHTPDYENALKVLKRLQVEGVIKSTKVTRKRQSNAQTNEIVDDEEENAIVFIAL